MADFRNIKSTDTALHVCSVQTPVLLVTSHKRNQSRQEQALVAKLFRLHAPYVPGKERAHPLRFALNVVQAQSTSVHCVSMC